MPTYTKHTPGTASWLDLATTDQDGAKSFYTDLFGWSYQDNPMEVNGEQQMYSMASIGGETVAGIFTQMPQMREQGIPPMWQVYLTVEDVDASAAKAKALGGKITVEPMDVEPMPGMKVGRMAVIQDPGGAHASLWQPFAHIGSSVKMEDGSLHWAENLSGDQDATVKFYTELFGLTSMSMPGMDDGYYMILMAGDEACFGVMNMPKEWKDMNIPPHIAIYMQVADVDKSVELAVSKGATVMNPPMDVPNVGRMAHIHDPQGATLALTTPTEQQH